MRLCQAARTLLEQVECHHDTPESFSERPCGVVGDADGFGVRRTVMVPVDWLLYVQDDQRVKKAVVVTTGLGDVGLVHFHSGRLGDLAQKF